MCTRRFEKGERVLLTRSYGTMLERPFEQAGVVDWVYGSIYQYIVEHDDGSISFVMENWVQPLDFTITEDVEIADLVDVYSDATLM